MLIEFTDVDYAYRGDWLQRIHALKKINLSVPEGSSFGYLGANGAGKSTGIKLLTGMLHGYSGSIKLFGQELGPAQLRENIGYLPEHPFFYEHLKVKEYFAYLAKLSKMSASGFKHAVDRIYDALDLGDLRERKLGSFSKGMRQRFGLGQALIHSPQLLILDEPFSGLDPLWRSRFREILHQERARGATLFFSSHILSDVEDLCDHYAVIDHGCILEQGLLSDLFEEAPLHLHGQGIMPESIAGEQKDGYWIWQFSEDKREECLSQCRKHGVEILRLERPRQALEDYFVNKVKSYHAAESSVQAQAGARP